eukprot:scaffold11617_cov130-Isochrysis_galbana.AAC.2
MAWYDQKVPRAINWDDPPTSAQPIGGHPQPPCHQLVAIPQSRCHHTSPRPRPRRPPQDFSSTILTMSLDPSCLHLAAAVDGRKDHCLLRLLVLPSQPSHRRRRDECAGAHARARRVGLGLVPVLGGADVASPKRPRTALGRPGFVHGAEAPAARPVQQDAVLAFRAWCRLLRQSVQERAIGAPRLQLNPLDKASIELIQRHPEPAGHRNTLCCCEVDVPRASRAAVAALPYAPAAAIGRAQLMRGELSVPLCERPRTSPGAVAALRPPGFRQG